MFRHIIQPSPRNTQQSSILDVLDELRAHHQRFRPANDPRQTPALGKPDCLLEAIRPRVGRGDVAGFGQEEDGVDVLLVGEQDADLGAEGRQENGTVFGEPVHAVEDVVDEVVHFYCGCLHAPIVGFE